MARRLTPALSMVVGVAATVVFGAFGAFGWLAWVWSGTPERVRATVTATQKGVVVAVASISLAAFLLGIVMTVISLVHSFDVVSGGSVDPSNKARYLAEGISGAMNWSLVGLVPLPFAVVVALVSGYRLLRKSDDGTA